MSEPISNILSSGELDGTSVGFPTKVLAEEKDIMVNLVMNFLTM